MQALRGTISGAAAACVAVTAALVIASAPAASSRQDGRLLVTSAAARRYAGALERTNVAWPRREAVSPETSRPRARCSLSAPVRSRPLRAAGSAWSSRPATRPSLGRASALSEGGSSEALPGSFRRSSRQEPRPRWPVRPASTAFGRPYAQIQTAVSGEEVGVALAAAWHEKGFTGKGVKVAVIDGGFKGVADRQASGDLPANVVTQDFCGGQLLGEEDHGTAVAEIVHEMAPTRSCTSRVSALKSTSPRPRRGQRARESP